jgi:hypothetical protein
MALTLTHAACEGSRFSWHMPYSFHVFYNY